MANTNDYGYKAWPFKFHPSGGPYLTYKAAKKSGYFCGPQAPGPIIAKSFGEI